MQLFNYKILWIEPKFSETLFADSVLLYDAKEFIIIESGHLILIK